MPAVSDLAGALAGVRKPSRNEPAVGGARRVGRRLWGFSRCGSWVVLAVLSFNAADDVAAIARQHAMMIAMVDGHGGCGSVY